MKKLKNLLFSSLFLLAFAISFTACSSDDDNLIDDGTKVELPSNRAFILNSGNMGNNNAGLAFYAPKKNAKFIPNIFKKQNNKGLGDTGQSIIKVNNYMYVIVSGSKVLYKLNSAGVEVASCTFSEEDGSPRCMTYKNDYLYVTLYSNQIVKIKADNLSKKAYLKVGSHPEEIVTINNHLYVANSGYHADFSHNAIDTISQIDIESFKITKQIEVKTNPNQLLVEDGNLYVLSWGDFTTTNPYYFQKVNIKDGSYNVENIAVATKVAKYKNMFYLVNSVTDWNTYATTVSYATYDSEKSELTESTFLQNAPKELMSTSVYMFCVNPYNGDLYIGTSDYKTNGNIYRFDNKGVFNEKFDCGGINPMNMIFFE